MQQIWNQTKNEIDNRLADAQERVKDPPRRRKFEEPNRSNYENILLQLYDDRWLGAKETDAGLEMHMLFNSKRNRRRPVSEKDLADFKELQKEWEQYHDRRRT